ncbi:MAG: hypothetical protein ABI307_10870 [Mycobacterium sp.]
MSWLLIAATPTLLMLTAIGLDRIENALNHGAPAAAEVPTPVEVAETATGQLAYRPNPRVRPTQQLNRV